MTATVSITDRDLLSLPASWTGGEAHDLVLCFPKGHTGACVFHLMDAAGGVALVPTELGASSPANVEVEVWITTWSLHWPRTQRYSHLLPPGHSWRCGSQHGPLHPHRAGSCSHCCLCGQSEWEVWVTWASDSHRAQRCLRLSRVIHWFLRWDKLYEQTVQLEETPALFCSSDLSPQM